MLDQIELFKSSLQVSFSLTNNLQGEIIDVKDDDRSDNEEKPKIKNKSNLSFSAYQSQGFKTFADSYFYS